MFIYDSSDFIYYIVPICTHLYNKMEELDLFDYLSIQGTDGQEKNQINSSFSLSSWVKDNERTRRKGKEPKSNMGSINNVHTQHVFPSVRATSEGIHSKF